MRELIGLTLAILMPISAEAAGGNGGTPTKTPPTVGKCSRGAILLDLGSKWEVDASQRPIEIDVIDYDTLAPTIVVLASLENAILDIAGLGSLPVGNTITIDPGETIFGTLSLSADTAKVELSAFGPNNDDCIVQKKIIQ